MKQYMDHITLEIEKGMSLVIDQVINKILGREWELSDVKDFGFFVRESKPNTKLLKYKGEGIGLFILSIEGLRVSYTFDPEIKELP